MTGEELLVSAHILASIGSELDKLAHKELTSRHETTTMSCTE